MNKKIPQAHINIAQSQARQARLGFKVTGVLDRYGVIADVRIAYHAYAKAMDRVQRKYPWMVDRIREHGILRARFEGSGLDSAVLDELDKFVIYNAQTGP